MDLKTPDTATLLLSVNMLLMKRLAAHMRQSSRQLSPVHAGMLLRISEAPCTISELARHQCTQLPTISRSVSVLVERGLLERWIPEQNRRTTMVRLTSRGRREVEEVMSDVHSHTQSLLKSLSETDDRKVRAALSLLADRILPLRAEDEHDREAVRKLARPAE
jgi:DNA-binding MarR family transcriptional regulator